MKFKLFIFGLLLWTTSGLGMEEKLRAETIVNHPKFIIAKQEFEKLGGSIKIWPDRVWLEVKQASGTTGRALYFAAPNFWEEIAEFYQGGVAWRTHHWELVKTLPKSLHGLCILNVAKRYQDGEQLAMESFSQLPEDSQELVLKLQGYC